MCARFISRENRDPCIRCVCCRCGCVLPWANANQLQQSNLWNFCESFENCGKLNKMNSNIQECNICTNIRWLSIELLHLISRKMHNMLFDLDQSPVSHIAASGIKSNRSTCLLRAQCVYVTSHHLQVAIVFIFVFFSIFTVYLTQRETIYIGMFGLQNGGGGTYVCVCVCVNFSLRVYVCWFFFSFHFIF